MDADSLERTLMHAAADLGVPTLLEGVIIPLVESISIRWVAGTTTIAQEHLTSTTLRTFLENIRTRLRSPSHAPRFLITTPKDQVHEIGALIVSIVASMQGWNVTYLGPDLPASEIADAARLCRARAVGLSIVFPEDDPNLDKELQTLRRILGSDMPILIGGRAAQGYSAAIKSINAQIVQTLPDLIEALNVIRRYPSAVEKNPNG
jgi:cobalamin-dependent methionine synthase I